MSGGRSTDGSRRPGLVAGGVVLLLLGGLFVLAGLRSEDEPDDPTRYASDYLTTPVDTTVGLRIGGFHIMENTGPDRRSTTLTRDDIVLTGPGGELALEAPDGREVGVDDDVYRAVAFVRVREPGVHQLRITGPDAGPAVVQLNDDGTGGSFSRFAAAAFFVLVGVLIACAGLVTFAAGFTRRRAAAARVGPGWYPDPAAPQHLRWFDGMRWTEHRGGGSPPPADLAGREP